MHFAPVSLAALARSVEAGERTPRAVIGEAAERIDALEGEIGAFVHRASRRELDEAAKASGPLAGIPLGFKDIYDTADMPTEYGSPIYEGFRPPADAALVAIARERGGVVMGKTTTTEFAFLTPTKTRNPVRPAHTPGGSSSGSAAAVACGMVAGAFGSQTAGSVIRPASFCGVAAFKPSFRLLPTVGMKTFAWTLDTVGLFAAGVRDVALLAEILSGRDLRVDEGAAPGSPRIGLYRSAVDGQLEPAMAQAFERARAHLEKAGATVFDVQETADLSAAHRAQLAIQIHEGSVALAHERRVHSDRLSPRLRQALDDGEAVGPQGYDEARKAARLGRRAVAALFETADVLLAPSALGAAPASLASTGDPAMNRLWTVTGNPCINVPGLSDPDGLPLGLSVVGRFGADRETLAAAAFVERALGGQ